MKNIFLIIAVCLSLNSLAQNDANALKQKLGAVKSDDEKADILNDIAWALSETGQFNEALEYCLKARELSTKINNGKELANSWLIAGSIYENKKEYSKALDNYNKSVELFREAKIKAGIYRALDHIAGCYENFGKHELALKTYKLELKEAKNDTNQKKALAINIRIGRAYTALGKYPEAHKIYLDALRLSQKAGDKLSEFYCNNNLGILYKIQRKFDDARDYHQKALDVVTEIKDSAYIAGALFNFGAFYYEIRDFKKAIEFNTKSMEVYRLIHDEKSVADCIMNEGSMYQAVGNNDKALENYKKVYSIYEQGDNTEGLVDIGINMGILFATKKDLSSALKYLDQSRKIIEEKDLIEERQKCYSAYAEVYSLSGDYKKAYESFLKFTQLKDSVVNSSNNDNILKQQIGFEFEKKEELLKAENEKIIAVSEKEKQRRNIVIVSISAGLLLLGVLTLVIFRSLLNNKQKNKLISEQKELVEEKQKDITDSINYALRIQEAILPPIQPDPSLFGESFILFKPKDIVSGDFYWYSIKNGKKIIAATDCTGHGVPGAFMSMLGITFLNEIVNEKGITRPSEILGHLRDRIKATLKQKGLEGESKDGMDIAMISLDEKNKVLEFAGANNPLWICRSNGVESEMIEITPDKRPIGYFKGMGLPFTKHSVDLKQSDCIYIFTDGYADQFGGPRGKKFKYKQLSDLFSEVAKLPMSDQKNILNDKFNSWKGSLEQVDDVLIIGLRI